MVTTEHSRTAALTVTLLATGEIKLTRPPHSKGGGRCSSALLDHKRKLQDIYTAFCQGEREDIEEICPSTPSGFGRLGVPTKFGARAKATIREVGAVLDGGFGTNVAFLTWTIPGSGEEIYDAACKHSARFTQDVMQWLRDTASGVSYVWVYEFQKRGALHQHVVVGSKDSEGISRILEQFPMRMRQLFLKWSRDTGTNLFLNHQTGKLNIRACLYGQKAMRAYKSCAKYLTKYLSKHRTKSGRSQQRYPARWWRCSNSALRLADSQRERIRFVGTERELDRLLGVITHRAQELGGQIVSYPNKKFPWLMNARVWSPSVAVGQFLFPLLKRRALDELTSDCRVLQSQTAPRMVAEVAPAAVAAPSFAQAVGHVFGKPLRAIGTA